MITRLMWFMTLVYKKGQKSIAALKCVITDIVRLKSISSSAHSFYTQASDSG